MINQNPRLPNILIEKKKEEIAVVSNDIVVKFMNNY
jgi:hypothetical protein